MYIHFWYHGYPLGVKKHQRVPIVITGFVYKGKNSYAMQSPWGWALPDWGPHPLFYPTFNFLMYKSKYKLG